MKLKKFLTEVAKGESAASRSAIEQAVLRKAAQIAVKKNIPLEQAEALVWKKQLGAQELYESLPKGNSQTVAKRERTRERPTLRVTKAEQKLDTRANRIMKSDPTMSYPRAVAKALELDPDLYTQYQDELSAGQFLQVPEPEGPRYSAPVFVDEDTVKRGKRKDDPGTLEAEEEDEDEEDDDADDDEGTDRIRSKRRKLGDGTCFKCSRVVKSGDAFCSHCGTRINR